MKVIFNLAFCICILMITSCSKDKIDYGHAKNGYQFSFNGRDTIGGFYVNKLNKKILNETLYSIQVGMGEYNTGFSYISITNIPINIGKFKLSNTVVPDSTFYSTRIFGGQNDVYNIRMLLSDEKDSINYIEIQEMDVESKKFKGNYSAIYYDQSNDNDVIVKGTFESTLPE